MPERQITQRARAAKRRGTSASKFGPSKARRAGVAVKRKRSSSHGSARRKGSRSRRSSSR